VRYFGHRLSLYNRLVARGWESKSVEQQQELAATASAGPRRVPSAAELEKQRKKEGLALSRRRVIHELESAHNPRHRQVLQAALHELDAQLARLG